MAASQDCKLVWDRISTEELISRYRALPELWDINDPDYRDRSRKQAATESIARHFSTTEAEVNRKIHNLRNQMSQELRKLRSVKTGDYDFLETRYQGKWPFFDSLAFILPAIFARSAASSVNVVPKSLEKKVFCSLDEVMQPVLIEENVAEDSEVEEWKPRKKPMSQEEGSRLYRTKTCHLEQDEFDIFGQFVASELRLLRSDTARRVLKRAIQKSILEASEEDEEMIKQGTWFRPPGCTEADAQQNVSYS